MTPTGDAGADEGGEAPCFAHLLDEPDQAFDDLVVERPGPSAGGRCVGVDTGGTRGDASVDADGDESAPPCA